MPQTTSRNAVSPLRRSKKRFDRKNGRRDFAFNDVWSGKQYGTKQVRPIFVEEADEIVVVTVYVYYF